MSEHSREPWYINHGQVFDAKHRYLGKAMCVEGATEHYIACVAACQGINPEAVQEMVRAGEVLLAEVRAAIDCGDDVPLSFAKFESALAKAKPATSRKVTDDET